MIMQSYSYKSRTREIKTTISYTNIVFGPMKFEWVQETPDQVDNRTRRPRMVNACDYWLDSLTHSSLKI
jgi:hypothetical protein